MKKTLMLSAAFSVGLITAPPVFAQEEQVEDFVFQYKEHETRDARSERRMYRRLQKETRAYCRDLDATQGDAKARAGCEAHLNTEVKREIEERN